MDSNTSFVMAARLKSLRENKGFSHVSLANALKDKYGIDISRDTLMNYEVSDPNHTKACKNKGMRSEFLWCFADFYGVSSDYLLGFSGDPAPKPAAVDELGLNPIVIEEIRNLAAEMGYFDLDDTSETPLQALNVFLNRSLETPLYEMINCLHDAVEVERSAAPSKLISDDDRKYIRGLEDEEFHAGYVLMKKLIDLHPDLRGRIHVIYGSQRLKPQVDEICDLFRSIVENMTGYRNFINEWD